MRYRIMVMYRHATLGVVTFEAFIWTKQPESGVARAHVETLERGIRPERIWAERIFDDEVAR